MVRKKTNPAPGGIDPLRLTFPCANCNSACPPYNVKGFLDLLPHPGTLTDTNEPSHPQPETSMKRGRGRPRKSHCTLEADSASNIPAQVTISEALSTLYGVSHLRTEMAATLNLCSYCTLLLSHAWPPYNEFRDLAVSAGSSFLSPYMTRVKPEPPSAIDIDPGTILQLEIQHGHPNSPSEPDEHDPLALSDQEDMDEDEGGRIYFSNSEDEDMDTGKI